MSKAEYTTRLTYMDLMKKKRDWLIDALVFLGKRWSWRPIETAPRDTGVLVYDKGVRVATLSECYYTGTVRWLVSGKMADNPIDYYLPAQPTHWMPLPEEPNND